MLGLLVKLLPASVRPWIDVGVAYVAFTVLMLSVLCWLATRRMAVRAAEASRLQMAMEFVYEALRSFSVQVIGPRGPEFLPLLGTLFIYILAMNLLVIVPGFDSPTSRLGVTAAMAVPAWLYVEYVGLRDNGLGGYFMEAVQMPDPDEKRITIKLLYAFYMTPLMFFVHIADKLFRMVSLSLRLCGNILGTDMVLFFFMMFGVSAAAHIFLPIPTGFPMYLFVLFLGFVQAFVFTLLTAAYLSLEVQGGH